MAERSADVAVVGGGLSGLVAARALRRAGLGVCVLEARARPGGKVCTEEVGGEPVDLGAHWIGPGQTRIAALAAELGLRTVPQHLAGRHVLELGGRRATWSGQVPPIPPLALAELQLALLRLERMARRVPLERPGAAPRAPEWDALTLEAWKRRALRTAGARAFVDVTARLVLGAEPAEVSLLFWLFYLRSAGGFTALTEFEGGAQQDHFAGGAQALCDRIAGELGDAIVLGAPVRAVEQRAGTVTVRADGVAVRARAAVAALSPALGAAIDWEPEPSPERTALAQRMPLGAYAKGIAVYERPWWRDAGLSGVAYADRGPVQMVVDGGSAGGRGVLVAFVTGAAVREHRAGEVRRAAVLGALGRLLGPRAERPLAWAERDWTAEPWSRGAPVGLMAPGTLSAAGGALAAALRRPHGRVHWAGTETARRWNGYMDGAVEAGERAAREVARRLAGEAGGAADRSGPAAGA